MDQLCVARLEALRELMQRQDVLLVGIQLQQRSQGRVAHQAVLQVPIAHLKMLLAACMKWFTCSFAGPGGSKAIMLLVYEICTGACERCAGHHDLAANSIQR